MRDLVGQVAAMGEALAGRVLPQKSMPVAESTAPVVSTSARQLTADDHFPRIVSMQDNHNHRHGVAGANTDVVEVYVGDLVEVHMEATDPVGDEPHIRMEFGGGTTASVVRGARGYRSSLILTVQEAHTGRQQIDVKITSPRPHHREGSFDDRVCFPFLVLPRVVTAGG